MIDDFEPFMEDLAAGQDIVVIVAPSVVANFPSEYLHLNGWLMSLGVAAVFDVSFGAELTVKSYVDYLQNHDNPKTVISQPCPAIVTYIQMYIPELLNHLAPVDSPMLHTMKMIKKYYPQFAQHKIAAISPCLAKKREFFEAGIGDYNIGFKSISTYIEKHKIDLFAFSQQNYNNPPAERAVGFSSPGGLLKTAERWIPGITEKSRKIEGVENIYSYLDMLPISIIKETSPTLIDCLNCERGCNGGPLTVTDTVPLDDMEKAVAGRLTQAVSSYEKAEDGESVDFPPEHINEILSAFWERELYKRDYGDLSINNRIIVPSEEELQRIYKMMRKTCDADFYNCSACGYGTCENMAIAIYNGLNRPENCHFFLAAEATIKTEGISENEKRLRNILSSTTAGFCLADEECRLIVVNSAFCNYMGMTREKLLGTAFLSKQFKRCSAESPYTSEIRISRPDGTYAYYLFIANPYLEDKEIVGYFAIVVDVNRYKSNTKNFPGTKIQSQIDPSV
ncbi:MAG: [Fe-Fe] hydrogenase large subunit C-terminal domain-containing protein [Fibrobacterota bacterium]